LYDNIKKKQFPIKSKVVVNCTGIFADEMRVLDKPDTERRVIGAKGTHLMFK
jgi:glycerol-3-phosphate dehydrogenase